MEALPYMGKEPLDVPSGMKLIIVYPLCFDAWDTFEPFLTRFTDTMKQFPPGIENYEVAAVCIWGEPDDSIKRKFYGIKHRFYHYTSNGCDIGACQMVGQYHVGDNALILGMTSRCYFHREGWGRRFLEAREVHGPGLYLCSVSRERGRLHGCTRAYALDSDFWKKYPHLIDTRAKGYRFETGDWCITYFVKQAVWGRTMQVTWDNTRELEDAHNEREEGIFRRGSQSAMLVWDRHSDIYRDATEDDKRQYERMCFEGKV